MGVDLLRQAQKWKDGLMDIRQLMANLVQQVTWAFETCVEIVLVKPLVKFHVSFPFQGFSAANMKPWKAHWDRQLYVSLRR